MDKPDVVSRPHRPLKFIISNVLQHSGAVTVRALAERMGEPDETIVELLAELVRDKKVEVIRSVAGASQGPDYYRWIQPADRNFRWQRALLEDCAGLTPLRFERRLALLAEC